MEKILKILRNKYIFDFMVENILKEKNDDLKVCFINDAFWFAMTHHCGIYYSKTLEEELIKISNKYNIELSKEYQKNSFLHVMTTPYKRGGHTKVVKRWIEFSPKDQKHSLFLLNAKLENIPDCFEQIIKDKNGDITILDDSSNIIDKSILLRQIASKYEYIVLHTHMYETAHLIAFGNYNFKRPVIFFNHADHCFWSGVSIIDYCLSFRKSTKDLCENRRNIKNNYLLPLPIEKIDNIVLKNKKELGLPEDKKIILSVGESYKFNSLNYPNIDFASMLVKILEETPDTIAIIIGIDSKDNYFSNAINLTNGRIKTLEPINDRDIFYSYINACDLYIQSYPMPSAMALLDVILLGKTKITFLNEITFDFVGFDFYDIYNELSCNSEEELINISVDLLKNNNLEYEKKIQKIFDLALNSCYKNWYFNLEKIIKNIDKYHKIQIPDKDIEIFSDNINIIDDIASFSIASNFENNSDINLENILPNIYSKSPDFYEQGNNIDFYKNKKEQIIKNLLNKIEEEPENYEKIKIKSSYQFNESPDYLFAEAKVLFKHNFYELAMDNLFDCIELGYHDKKILDLLEKIAIKIDDFDTINFLKNNFSI